MHDNQEGLAMIFTLGIVLLLFLIAMLFVTSALIEKKSAQNYNNLQKARMMALSGLERATSLLHIYNTEVEDITTFYSYSDESMDTNYLVDTLLTNINTGTFVISDSIKDSVRWIYLPQDHDIDTPITGRIAYFMGETDFGKIDINKVTDFSYFTFQYITSDMLNQIGANSDWRSPEHIAHTLRMSDTDITSDSGRLIRDELNEYFVFTSLPSYEAFWLDANANGSKIDSELFHRFNLARTDWDDPINKVTVDKIVSGNLYNILDTSRTSNDVLPWIANWKDAGGNLDARLNRRQIASNLIDYSDANSISTTDSGLTSGALPSYVGLEKTPYINELNLTIAFNLTAEKHATASTYKPKSVEITYVQADIETIDLYGTNSNVTAECDLGLTYSIVVDDKNAVGVYDSNDYNDWQSEKAYFQYDLVKYNNYLYQANWLTTTAPSYYVNSSSYWKQVKYNSSAGAYSTSTNYKIGSPDINYSSFTYTPINTVNAKGKTPPTPTLSWTTIGRFALSDINTVRIETEFQSSINSNDEYVYATDINYSIDTQTVSDSANYMDSNDFTFYIYNLVIKDLRVALKDSSGNLLDYSYMAVDTDILADPNLGKNITKYFDGGEVVLPFATLSDPVVQLTFPNGVPPSEITESDTVVINFQVDDPRVNMWKANWVQSTSGSLGSKYTGTTAHTNSSDQDRENITNNASLKANIFDNKTKIKNAPITNLSELGLIHRGNTWATINLKQYNSAEGVSVGGGGNSYVGGDANILDQVKLTDAVTGDKINVNTGHGAILDILLKNITIPITSNDITKEKIRDEFLEITWPLNEKTPSQFFKTRAEVLRDPGPSQTDLASLLNLKNHNSGISDEEEEEIIGGFMEQAEAEFNAGTSYYTIYIISEAIKDIGVIKGAKVGTLDGIDIVTSTQVIKAKLYKDTINGIKIKNYKYQSD